MKTTIALLLTFLFASALHAQKDPLSREWNTPVPPFRIAGNLYYVGAKDITSYLITTPKGHILIDGGFEETAPIIQRNVQTLGFRINDVRILIGSHAHYDHAGGLAALKKASGARFFASAGDAPYYASGGHDDPQFDNRLTFPPIAVDRILADGERVELGGMSLTAHVTAGHTPGCISWTFMVNDGGKRRDVIILGSPTAPEGFKLVDNARYPNIIADYRKQFALLRSLHPDVFLASHGMFFNLEEKRTTGKSFVDPEGYGAYVALAEKRFEDKVRTQSIAAHGLVLHNATMIDGTGAAARAGMDVIVRDDKIVDVVPSADAQHPDGAYVIDATGKFVMPGLVDIHAHLLLHPWTDDGSIAPRYDRQASLDMLRLFLRYGVTTVRDPGAETADAILLRNLVRDGKEAGPTIFTAGRILTYGENNPEPFVTTRTEEAVREEIRWQAQAGVDFVKVYASMPPELVAIAIEEAHDNDLPVIGHVQRTTWTEAARLGIDGVEHAAPWSDAYVQQDARGDYDGGLFGRVYWLEHLDARAIEEMVDALVEHHVVVDPTLMAMHTKFWGDDARYTKRAEYEQLPEIVRRGWPKGRFTNGWTQEQYARAQKSWPTLLQLTKKMFDRGVHLVAGTDAPTPWIMPGLSLHDELQLLADAGIPTNAIVRMATFDGARALRREKEFGSIAAGMRADLLVLSKDPLASIANTRAIEVVVHNGHIVAPE